MNKNSNSKLSSKTQNYLLSLYDDIDKGMSLLDATAKLVSLRNTGKITKDEEGALSISLAEYYNDK